MSNISLDAAVELGRYRWSLAILATLPDGGARFVEMLNAVGLSRDSLSRSLEKLIAAGWVVRNPGHGHPLRPEYLLTRQGQEHARVASAVISAQKRLEIGPADMSRWSLPLIHVLSDREKRFRTIETLLSEATPRALSAGLKGLAEKDLVNRQIIDNYPPITQYSLSKRGQSIADALRTS